MRRQELNMQSPLRILDKETHGGLTPGQMGVVVAKPGVGKTTFLVQVGLDHLLREHKVLHLSAGRSVDHIQAWYDALFDDLANVNKLEDRGQVRMSVHANSVIHTYGSGEMTSERIEKAIDLYVEHQGFSPRVLIVEGYEWDHHDPAELEREIRAIRKRAGELGAELWIAAGYEGPDGTPAKVPAPCDRVDDIIDVALYLEPDHDHVNITILKEHADTKPHSTRLQLCGDTLRVAGDSKSEVALPRAAYALLSGACEGSEAAFGACAEEWGLEEVNFSFPGRAVARKRGIVELTNAQLERGHVTEHYIEAQLHRNFPKTPKFQMLLQTIWHQVITAGEVFVIGFIQEDNTVKGGTGWAAELGRHLKKPVYVYDQEKRHWYGWAASSWREVEAPKITRTRFTGTGTRYINEDGKAEIRALFERSFGPAKKPAK